ncbi:MAG: hypothetical protein NTZ02_02975 [Candidatus Woesearchaeota archaeon]|nr:hypothetical protein [Candidatus Woesearchaeota archaeon]
MSLERACPLCGNEVKGNRKTRYYCKRCNLLFDEKETILKEEVGEISIPTEEKKEIAATAKKDKGREIPKEPERIFITSAKAKRYHVENCPFAQKIRPEKRIIFRTREDAEKQGYRPCTCLKNHSAESASSE